MICFTFGIFWTFLTFWYFWTFLPPPNLPLPPWLFFNIFGLFDFCRPPLTRPPALPCAHSFTFDPPLFNFLICCPFYFFSPTHTPLTPHPRPPTSPYPLHPPFHPCPLDPPLFTFFELLGFLPFLLFLPHPPLTPTPPPYPLHPPFTPAPWIRPCIHPPHRQIAFYF